MGTGYTRDIDVRITGTIYEEVASNNTELFEKELELLVAKYQLEAEWNNERK